MMSCVNWRLNTTQKEILKFRRYRLHLEVVVSVCTQDILVWMCPHTNKHLDAHTHSRHAHAKHNTCTLTQTQAIECRIMYVQT